MLTQTDDNGNTTAFEYNVINKLVKRIDPGGRLDTNGEYIYVQDKIESYTYNADGSMSSKVDKNGNTTIYLYDIHGRLLSQLINSDSITYTYDDNGNQLTMTDSTGITSRTYDEQNRVKTKIVPDFGQTNFIYDTTETGGCYSQTTFDPNSNSTKKMYDKAGKLINVIAGNNTTTYEYYSDGSRKSVIYPDGAKEEYTYFKDGLNKP